MTRFSRYLMFLFSVIAGPVCAETQPTAIDISDVTNSDDLLFIWTQSPFVKWPLRSISWCYFEEGAPQLLEDRSEMESLIMLALHQWEQAADVVFTAQSELACQTEHEGQLIHFRWSSELVPQMPGNTTVRRGIGEEVSRFGYEPILGATVHINSRSRMIEKLSRVFTSHRDWEADLLQCLTHEVGHALGLGHSEFADSIMYANPYSPWLTLGTSDVAEIQGLYGPASDNGSAIPLLEAYGYFKKRSNDWPSADASMESTLVEADGWMFSNFEYPDEEVRTLAFEVVQADGNVRLARLVERPFISVACNRFGRCGASYSIARAELLRGLPAETRILHLVNDEMVGRYALTVGSMPVRNRMPPVSFASEVTSVKPGDEVAIQLKVGQDPDGDDLVGTLHVPGSPWRTFRVGRTGGLFRSVVSFPDSGLYEIFVSLDDGAPTYPAQGFENSGGSQYARLIRRLVLVVE